MHRIMAVIIFALALFESGVLFADIGIFGRQVQVSTRQN